MNNKKAFVARGHGLLKSSYLVLGNAIKKMYSEETSVKGNEMILDLSSFELSYVVLNSANCNISRKKSPQKFLTAKNYFSWILIKMQIQYIVRIYLKIKIVLSIFFKKKWWKKYSEIGAAFLLKTCESLHTYWRMRVNVCMHTGACVCAYIILICVKETSNIFHELINIDQKNAKLLT